VGVLERMILAPLPAQLPLLRLLIPLLAFAFLAFAGVMIVSTGASLLARPWRPSVARRLRELPFGGPAPWIVFGLAPPAGLVFLLSASLAGAGLDAGAYLARILALALAAFVALRLHARRGHPAAGLIGLLFLLGAAFHFVATLTLVTFPEKWARHAAPLPFLYSIQPAVQFKLFLACSAFLSGAAILLSRGGRPDPESVADRDDEAALRRVGCGLILGGALVAPPLLVWDLYTAPDISLTLRVFGSALLMLGLLLAGAILALTMLRRGHARHATAAAILGLALLGTLAYRGQAARADAAREPERMVAVAAEARYAALVAEQESRYRTDPPDEALGERIYRERCSSCHAFERRLVGPPYDEVVPKYAGDLAALAEFILNPRRVDTSYPPMPSQGLRAREAQAAAIFLALRVTGEADASVFGPGASSESRSGEPGAPARTEEGP